jgi:hypothetical protein
VNFLYDFEFEGYKNVIGNKAYENPEWTQIKPGKKTVVAEM